MARRGEGKVRAPLEPTLGGSARVRERIAELGRRGRGADLPLIDSLVLHLRDGFALMSATGVNLEVNQAFCDMVGFTRDELVGCGIPQPYSPPEAVEDNRRAFERVVREDAGSLELTFMRKNGERFPALVTPTVMRDRHGRAVAVLATVKDMSELRHAEAAVRESEARYRGLVDGMLEGLAYCRVIYDVHERVVDWVYLAVNPAFERLTGLHDAAGKTVSELLPTARQDAPGLFETYGRVAGSGAREEFEIDFAPLGRTYHVSAFSPAQDHFVAVFEDVSDRRQAEWEAERTLEFLALLNEGRSVTELVQAATSFVHEHSGCDAAGVRLRDGDDYPDRYDAEGYESVLRIPLRAGAEPLGLLQLNARREDAFSGGAIALWERLAGYLAVSLAKVRAEEQQRALAARLESSLADTVFVLGATVELRDPYTAGHERRVAALAEAIARRLDWSEAKCVALRFAASVHDVGKISVPAEILTKPTRLSADEFRLIQGHSQAGHDLLASISFDMPIAEIVLQHHERMDGSGYPRGLRGEQILPEARVLAVADVVEAMITDRPYRPALSLGEALLEIGAHARGRFDPDVAEACRRLFDEDDYVLAD
jgi:PAS domain S-box-containing protein